MFKIVILATCLAVSSAYLNHGPAVLNHPNYGPYHGGYSVADHGVDYQPTYLSAYRPHGPVPAYPRHPVPAYPSHPVAAYPSHPVPVPIPGPLPAIQKLGHTGYAYAPARPLHLQPAPIQHAPVALPQVHQNGYAHQAGYHAAAQGNQGPSYVVAPSVSFSQHAPKQIAPAAPVSKVVRIPYAYPSIQSPQPISHPVSHPGEVHGW